MRRDRASVVATAIRLIIETAPRGAQMAAIENVLRDEFADIGRQIAGDREMPEFNNSCAAGIAPAGSGKTEDDVR